MGEGLTRREFLKSAARFALLGGIAAAGFRLLTGWRRRSGETCTNEGVCRGCGAFSGCGLPQALSARERAPWARGRS